MWLACLWVISSLCIILGIVFKGLVLGPMKDRGPDQDRTDLGLDCSPGPAQGPAKCGPSPGRLVLGSRTDAGPVWTGLFWA